MLIVVSMQIFSLLRARKIGRCVRGVCWNSAKWLTGLCGDSGFNNSGNVEEKTVFYHFSVTIHLRLCTPADRCFLPLFHSRSIFPTNHCGFFSFFRRLLPCRRRHHQNFRSRRAAPPHRTMENPCHKRYTPPPWDFFGQQRLWDQTGQRNP